MAIRNIMEQHGIKIQDIMTKEDIARFKINMRDKKEDLDEHKQLLFANSKFENIRELKQIANADEYTALVQVSLLESMDAMRMPKVKSDFELQDRIVEYFQKCVDRGSSPTFEEVALYCGYSVIGLMGIIDGKQAGFSPETKEILLRTKQAIQNFDAKMVMAGKSNVVAYIFRAKNYYGMVDKVENVITAKSDDSDNYNEEDIASRYKDMGDVEQ